VLTDISGSHIIYILQKTRRYKVISIDNNHNSLPAALSRVSLLSKSELPPNPSDIELQSTEIDAHKCDLSKPEQVRAVFEKYGKGGIWGVIHVAVSRVMVRTHIVHALTRFSGLQSRRRIHRNPSRLLFE
jgi:UDP-glucose 4-epimerase